MRLGVYVDLQYQRQGGRISTDNSFSRVLIALAEHVGGLTVLGRINPTHGIGAIDLPADKITFLELPAYPSLHRVPEAVSAFRRSLPIFDRALDDLDGIWLFGPHPLSTLVGWRAAKRGVPTYLGVRQHFPDYLRGRFSPLAGVAATGAAHTLEFAFRRLARNSPTVVVGEDLAARWRGVARELYVTPFAIVDTDDVVSVGEVAGEWHDPTRLLSVGRLDPEKNPLLLPKLLGDLGVGFHMRVIGDGKLRVAVGQRARSLGVIDSFELAGHIPFGPALRQEFRNADCLVHISHTEGVPQVLYEAMAAGLPIVATDVGGVRSALGNGRSGSFVPPNDTKAMASEINRMAANPSKRREMALHGREEVLRHTLDKQAAGLAAFFEANRSLERPR